MNYTIYCKDRDNGYGRVANDYCFKIHLLNLFANLRTPVAKFSGLN